jgi:predicted HTH transcriptional regulator
MENLNELHIEILRFIHENAPVSSSEILRGVRTPIALATLKRALHSLMGASLIESEGKGRATRYRVIPRQLVLMPLDTFGRKLMKEKF